VWGNQICAVVLAAGRGTRLRPLTELRPKALCPVGNVALVDHALARVAGADVAVNAHHLGEALVEHLSGAVHVSWERDEPLGTAGALGALRDWIDGRHVLVVNSDAFHPPDLSDLVSGWDGERVRLRCVRDPGRADFEGLRFAGASLMPWAAVRDLAPVPSGLYEVVWRHHDLDMHVASGPFFDCGTPREYLDANLAASGGESVIGEGARIEGEVIRSVVWPGGVVAEGERLVEAIRVGDHLTVETSGRP